MTNMEKPPALPTLTASKNVGLRLGIDIQNIAQKSGATQDKVTTRNPVAVVAAIKDLNLEYAVEAAHVASVSAMTPANAVYDGRELRGTIARVPTGFIAVDADGKKIGVFATQAEAVRRVLTPRAVSVPPTEKTPDFDAENALRRAIYAMMKGGAA